MENGLPKEVAIAKLLDNPHCLQIFDCWQLPTGEFIVAMPLAKYGALSSSTKPEITVLGACQLLFEMGSALAHMHSRGIVHRDIKPANILIGENGYILCDYSVSSVINEGEMTTGIIGTSVFMAPEISNNFYKPKPTDIWALGITIYVLIYGQYPFGLDRLIEQMETGNWCLNQSKSIMQEELEFPPRPVLPIELRVMIEKMLAKNPDDRLTAQDIFENEWLNERRPVWEALMFAERDSSFPSLSSTRGEHTNPGSTTNTNTNSTFGRISAAFSRNSALNAGQKPRNGA